MDTAQIEEALLSRTDINTRPFLGVYPINHIPWSKCVVPFCLIYNTAAWPSVGRHWVAISQIEKDKVECFDSLNEGDFYPNELANLAPVVTYNSLQLQSNCSSVCGEYCIFYIYCRLKGIPFQQIVTCFSPTKLGENDKLVYKIVHSNFAISKRPRPYPVINKKCIQSSVPSM